jgi:type VI secretion system protein ImpA
MDGQGPVPGVSPLAMPLPGERQAGDDLRQDFSPQSLYYRLRDARSEAREIERRLDHNDPEADAPALPRLWRTVHDLAEKALTERTKDLEIAAWLIEALVRMEGLTGLATGSALIATLVETLWDHDLYPLPDEDGIATRLAPIAGLNGASGDGTLMQPLRKCPLFPGPDGAPVTYWQYKQSEDLETITDAARRKQWQASGVVPLAELAAAARQAGDAHLVYLRSAARDALAAWTRMGDLMDARAGRDAPPTGRVRDLLRAIVDIAAAYAPPDEPVAEPESEAEEDHGATDLAPGGTTAAAAAPRPVTREDMLRELARISDYFRRTEPQSPLAYTLEEAVRRGRLTWPELLAELVPDNNARHAMLNTLGIRPPPPAG